MKFYWGVVQSAFQFEMGDPYRRNIDSRSDWWIWVRDPYNIKNELVSGDLPEEGINNYDLYEIDHRLAKNLGLNAYQLTIEWSRIFPCPTFSVDVSIEQDGYGFIKKIKIRKEHLEQLDELANKREVQHYMDVLKNLKKLGFTTFVTLNHQTNPVWIHDPIEVRANIEKARARGWVDEKAIIEFAKFVAYVAWKFDEYVDYWATFDEPMVTAELGYLAPYVGWPPGILNPTAAKKVILNQVIAHARAYDSIKKFSDKPVGIILNIIPAYPLNPNNPKDQKAAENYDLFHNRLFLEAVNKGRLDIEISGEYVKIPHLKRNDWIGNNYYTREVVKYIEPRYEELPLVSFVGVEGYGYSGNPNSVSPDNNPTSDFGWEVFPRGLYDSTAEAYEYNKNVFITENGIADSKDILRPRYIVDHVKEVKNLIENGIKVGGYFHWALTDNYEWAMGFKIRFGLYEVDLITKERIPRRKSVETYKKVVEEGIE
ncbi:beta-galactosidase [Thermococcus chitonophagus]|uniref:Beta-galactosidase n=1 Tax=Thermococcus chitonophagus TaxID=54262 RepID=A0A160VSF2_9EURY|nr:beta-galactosidase BgaS [Thermococcus chitonophagus]ASJ16103.1 beta-galactosidase [Thermococcus chitonophagus]CUX77356.1 Beta-galactosidase / Beta-glucosidase / Beta-fucosidase [Thermococcus chitonophagus]